MSANRPRLAFIGDMSGPLAARLKPYADLIPSGNAPGAGAADGLLLDGSAASAADEATVKAALDSGKLLAVASPGDGISQTLLKLTGQAPGPGAALVTYRRSAGRAGYDCTLLPPLKVKRSAYSESGAVAGAAQESSPAPEIGPALVAALNAPPGAGPGEASLGADLTPPQGALAGYTRCITPITNTWDYPSINNNPDDSTVQTADQTVANQFTNDFYVYWVNGAQGGQPYYVVIMKQTGPMALGTMVANNSNSRGWFQTYFQLFSNAAFDSNGNHLAAGWSLDHYSPKTSSGQVPITISETMQLYARTQSGMGPVQFDAQVQDLLDIPGWAVLDQTSSPITAWQYYQSGTWNPVTNPYDDFPNWWSQVYGDHDYVDPMPDTSYGSIQFEGYTVWRLSPPLFTPPATFPYNPPPALTVMFSGLGQQVLSLLHNIAGCLGAEGSKHHHLFVMNNYWGWAWQINLAQVVQQQNIGDWPAK